MTHTQKFLQMIGEKYAKSLSKKCSGKKRIKCNADGTFTCKPYYLVPTLHSKGLSELCDCLQAMSDARDDSETWEGI